MSFRSLKNIKKVVALSTDKHVLNKFIWATKLAADKLLYQLIYLKVKNNIFSCKIWKCIWEQGSVVPIFLNKKIENILQ